MGGILKLRKLQFGKEVTAGTGVLPTALYRGTGSIKNKTEVVHPPENVGYLSPVNRGYIPKISGGVDLDDVEATFEQLPYLLEMGVKKIGGGVKDGAGSGYVYAYTLPTTAENTIQTMSVEGGDNQEMVKGTYAFAEEITISGKSGEGVKMSASLVMRQALPNKLTASTLAFVAASKKITDSANGLAGFTTGMRITVSGTTSNDGTYTVATGGVAGEIVVSETLVNESAGTAFTVAQTFTAVALATVEEILFQKGKLYIDAVGGTLGATQKSSTFMDFELKITTGWKARFTGDGSLYFTRAAAGVPQAMLDVTFEHDGSAVSEKDAWLAKTPRKIRIGVDGNALATAGTSYSTKKLMVDIAGMWDSFDTLDEVDGNDVVKGTFAGAYDATASLFCTVTVVNELSALV